MNKEILEKYLKLHSADLLENVLPFWLKHAVDKLHGGYYTALDREGKLLDTDKSVWFQGRFAWTLAKIYNELEPKEGYLELAKSGLDFIEGHCIDSDKRMFFRVTADGQPVIKRLRYVFSESFALIALAEYAYATKSAQYLQAARALYQRIYEILASGVLQPKFQNRDGHGLGLHMIMVNTLQILRRADPSNAQEYSAKIANHIEHIKMFVKDDLACVLEQVDSKGNFMPDHLETRICNPGHSIEAGWFIMDEYHYTHDESLKNLALKIIDYAWNKGWDKEYGGITYFKDALDKPVSEYWHDMKFWWPQNEATIANLMAYQVTKDDKYFTNYEKVFNWSLEKFVDREYGEWFGYLHRDGSVSSTLKGNIYKGPFHIPRMHILCINLLKALLKS